MDFDLIVKNGTIRTIDQSMSTARWFGVKNGRIAAIGKTDDAPDTAKEILDLQEKAVLPGLIDSHVHATMTGIGLIGVDLAGIDTSQGILDAVEKKYRSLEPGCSVLCGANMNLPADMADKRVPTCKELDEITGDIPVMLIFWTAHGGIMNSAAIKRAQLLPDMEYVKDDGYFNEDKVAIHIIQNIYNLFTREEFEGIYRNLSNIALSKGMTTIHNLDGMWVTGDRDVDILIEMKDSLPVEFVPYTQTFDYKKVANRYHLPRVGGCLLVDGSPPQLTAAYEEPYTCNPKTRGFLNYTDKELYDLVYGANRQDMQTAFHAIGDRAIDQIIHIYQQVDRELDTKHLRNRIEHFSLPSDKHIEMAKELNLMIAAQPAIGNSLDLYSSNAFENFVSKEKAQLHENFARLIDNGLLVMGGSDSPCSPFDPFVGINCCVNPHNPARAVSLDTALRMYTYNGAYGCHKESEKGSIEIGKKADFIVLYDDIYNHTDNITSELLHSTYVNGAKMYSK